MGGTLGPTPAKFRRGETTPHRGVPATHPRPVAAPSRYSRTAAAISFICYRT